MAGGGGGGGAKYEGKGYALPAGTGGGLTGGGGGGAGSGGHMAYSGGRRNTNIGWNLHRLRVGKRTIWSGWCRHTGGWQLELWRWRWPDGLEELGVSDSQDE